VGFDENETASTGRRVTIALILVGGVAVGVAGGFSAHRYVPRSPLVRGVDIGGKRVPDRGAPAAFVATLAEGVRARRVRFVHGERAFDATLGEVGVDVDVDATLRAAAAVGHRGSVFRRLRESEAARRGAVDVPLVFTLDEAKARERLATFGPSIARAPVDATLDLGARTKHPDVDGAELDVDASVANLGASPHEDEDVVDLVTKPVRAHITLEDLVKVDVEKVVSAYETTFVTWGVGWGRSINIKNAASKLDGTVLQPGDSFSFNDRVGPRTLERGFALAPEIQGDEMTTGVGGGTCQVSSTLHAAALFGALEIVERQAHSRPSSYTQMGLDATVSYPLADLRLRNSLPFPVLVHAYLPKPTAIRVEILGGDPVAKVEYKYGVANVEDFVRRIKVKPGLPPGKRIRHQKGSRGFDVTSFATVKYHDGRVDERHWFSGYRPAPEVFWVAPGTAEEDLPPLPEHAKGVEGKVASADDGTYSM
jgi:vancomycin resistance protein YoaR